MNSASFPANGEPSKADEGDRRRRVPDPSIKVGTDPVLYSADVLCDTRLRNIYTTDACLDVPNGRAARVGRRYLNSP